jgi:hypothetical protein
MKYQTVKFSALLCVFALTACGGGGGGSSSGTAAAPAPTGGTPPPSGTDSAGVIKVGAITGFGSVFVDNERFETSDDGTTYSIDDSPGDEDDLKIGMVVKVRGTERNSSGEWIADEVEFEETLKGPVDSVGADFFVAVGQRVNVSTATNFDSGLSLAVLDEGDIVEVSGLRNENDEVDGTFVELKNPGEVDEYEVLGQIRELDTDNGEFKVGGLLVRYKTIPAELDDLSGGLANGLLVEVEDENLAYQAGDLIMDATKVEGESAIEFEDHEGNDDDSEVEFKGVISRVIDDSNFEIGSIQVRHSSGTEFSGGTAADLVVGALVEVDGVLTENGIVADEIEFESGDARLAGPVTGVGPGDGEFEVMGVAVDGSGAEIKESDDENAVTLGTIEEGDFLEIRGREVNNTVIADEIEGEDPDDDSEMRGVLDAFDATAQTVTIFGKLIQTNSQTQYECAEEEVCDADKFFSRLHVGQTVVDADWDGPVTDTLLPAKELSIED